MGNKCLVTKLKTSVENNNLSVYDAVKIRVIGSVSLNIGANCIIDTLNGGELSDEGGTSKAMPYKVPNYTQKLVFSGDDSVFVIRNKDKIVYFLNSNTSTLGVNLSEFSMCLNLERLYLIRAENAIGDIVDLIHCNKIISIQIQGTRIKGVLDTLIQYHAENGNPKQMVFISNGSIYCEGSRVANGVSKYITIVSDSEYRISDNSDYTGGNVWKKTNGIWTVQGV